MPKKTSATQKGHYSAYKTMSTFSKNKKAKLARHLAKHPDDAIAINAAKNVPVVSARNGYKGTSHKAETTRMFAQQMRSVKTLERVRSFIKSASVTVLKDNEIYTPQRLFNELGIQPAEAKPKATGKTKRPTRRGSKKVKATA